MITITTFLILSLRWPLGEIRRHRNWKKFLFQELTWTEQELNALPKGHL